MPEAPLPVADPLPAAAAPDRTLTGIGLRLAAMAMLGIMFALVKLAAEQGVSLVESLFWRQLAALPVVWLWLRATGRMADIRTGRPWAHALRMVVGIVSMGLNYAAMILLPLAEATVISFAMPIFATVLAALLLREPTGPWRWGAVLLGFAGVLIVASPAGLHLPVLGTAVAMCGAVTTAFVTIIIRRLSQVEPTGAIVFWFSASSLLPLGLLMPFFADWHPPAAWATLAGLGLSGAVAQILLTAALRHGSVGAVMTMDYTALLWAVIYGYLLFGDLPVPSTWAGAPVIIAAGLVIAWRERRRVLAAR